MDAKPLVPLLRFPEFRDEWQKVKVEQFFAREENQEKATVFESDKILTVKLHANGVVRNERTGTLTGGTNYFRRNAGQFIFSKIDLLNGAFGIVPDELDGFYSSTDVPAFTFSTENSPIFFVNWLRENYKCLGIERTGTSATLKRVAPSSFRALSLLAASPAEQQKIAKCLTSLDELIAAERRKLEALRTHKKSLMQNLFPREGETFPRLRFPQFRDDGQLTFKPLNEVAKVTTGDKDTQNKVADGKYPFFVRSQNVERIDSFAYDGQAVLTSGDGVGVGENYHYINGKFDFHQRVYCIHKFDDGMSGEFFYYYFSTHFKKRVKQMSAKNSVDSVRMAMITEMPIWVPEISVQQRVADCLTSLDALITAQAKKLDTLKLHKQGLMQGLFPSSEET